MKRTSLALPLVLLALASITVPPPAAAQTTERVWDQGTVWAITYVETKPSMFNSYLKNLSQVWRAFLEEQKKTGDVISYQMLTIQNPRDGEPNLMLLTEFKNMAVFDQSLEQADKLSEKVMGSLEDLQTDNIAREELRTIRSNVLAREIHFKE